MDSVFVIMVTVAYFEEKKSIGGNVNNIVDKDIHVVTSD